MTIKKLKNYSKDYSLVSCNVMYCHTEVAEISFFPEDEGSRYPSEC
jgi:hypothetical protein